MTTFQNILLALVIVVCVLLIGMGLYLREYMFAVLGGLLLAAIVLVAVAILLKKGFDVLMEKHPRLVIGGAVVLYLILIALIFIEPAVPFFIGLLVAVGPVLIFLVEIRGHPENIGPGCKTIVVPMIAAVIMLALVWLFRPAEFSQFLSGVWQTK